MIGNQRRELTEAVGRTEKKGLGRRARRSRDIRKRLMSAAQRTMARRGIEATTIQEITDAADVGFGSFYNYFESKEAIVEAVVRETIESVGDALDGIADSVNDPAEIVSASVRHTLTRVIEDEHWGWFLIQSGLSVPTFRVGLVQRMARDIDIGIRAGRFQVADRDGVVYAVSGAVLALMSAQLRKEIGEDAPQRGAEVVLRMLGLSQSEASRVARLPLPAVELPPPLSG